MITGGTSGIGFAIAKKLATKYDLALIYKNNSTKAQSSASELSKVFPHCNFKLYKCEIGNYEAVDSTYALIKKDFKKSASVLVNSAGIASPNLFFSDTMENIQNILSTNLMGTINTIKIVGPDMYRQKSGKIINFSSIASSGGTVGLGVYGATKAAIDSLSRSLAAEMGHRNVQINTIRPGLVKSNMTRTLQQTTFGSNNKVDSEIANPPYGDFIEAEAIAEMAFFLIDNPFTNVINGSDITIDCGSSHYRRLIKLSDFDKT